MDNQTRRVIRGLELENEAKAQDLSIAHQRIIDLEQKLEELSGPEDGSVDASSESQVDFIRRIAASRTKFAQEAQDIVNTIDAAQESNSVDANA